MNQGAHDRFSAMKEDFDWLGQWPKALIILPALLAPFLVWTGHLAWDSYAGTVGFSPNLQEQPIQQLLYWGGVAWCVKGLGIFVKSLGALLFIFLLPTFVDPHHRLRLYGRTVRLFALFGLSYFLLLAPVNVGRAAGQQLAKNTKESTEHSIRFVIKREQESGFAPEFIQANSLRGDLHELLGTKDVIVVWSVTHQRSFCIWIKDIQNMVIE